MIKRVVTRRVTRIGVGILLAGAAFLTLLSTLAVFLPQIIDLGPVSRRIEAQLSVRLGGPVVLERIETSLWPRPRIVFNEVKFTATDYGIAEIDALWIYPKIGRLFSGELELSEIGMISPRMALQVPPEGWARGTWPEFSRKELAQRLAGWLVALKRAMPDLDISVRNGTLVLHTAGKVLFWFRHIDGHVDIDRSKIRLRGESNLWDGLDLHMNFNAEKLRSKGEIALRSFQPQTLIAFTHPDTGLLVTQAHGDLNFSFKTEGLDNAKATVAASWSTLTLARNGKHRTFGAGNMLADAIAMGGNFHVSLTELKLADPKLQIRGDLAGTRSDGEGNPEFSLEMHGNEVAVEPLRAFWLDLAGDIAGVANLFRVLKKGRVREVTFTSKGERFKELLKPANMVISGTIRDAELAIAKPAMEFRDVSGDATVRGGVLTGKIAHAAYGKSVGRDGRLEVGLLESNDVFMLDIAIDAADLQPLPSLLKQVLVDPEQRDGLDLIEKLRGNAKGRLMMGDRLRDIHITVDAADYDLSVSFHDHSERLRIQGEHLRLQGRSLEVGKAAVAMGRSRLSDVAGQVRFDGGFPLKVDGAAGHLALEELYPLLARLEIFSPVLNNVRGARGRVSIASVAMEGSLTEPDGLRFHAMGAFKGVALDDGRLPGLLELRSGRFDVNHNRLKLIDAQATLLDATVNGSGYLQPLYGDGIAHLDFRGTFGARWLRWMEALTSVPRQWSLRGPLAVAGGQFHWDRRAGTAFSGEVSSSRGPRLTVDLLANGEEWVLNKLQLEDEDSDASLRLAFKSDEIDAIFTGRVTQKTVDRLLVENEWLKGWVKGAFRATIVTDNIPLSTAHGSLDLQGLSIPWGLQSPVTVSEMALIGDGPHFHLLSSALSWHENSLSIQGKINLFPDTIRFDLDAVSERLDWNRLGPALEAERQRRSGDLSAALPLEGVIRLKTERFDDGPHRVSPLHTKLQWNNNKVTAALTDAVVCGVSIPGELAFGGNGRVDVKLTPRAKNGELGRAMSCFLGEEESISGKFSLDGEVTAGGKREELFETANGMFQFRAREGTIYELSISGKILNRIFTVLNVPRLFRAKLPDLGSQGFAYSKFDVNGKLHNGKLLFSEIVLDGESMKILGEGHLDLKTERIELEIMVAPLKTLDWIIGKIPLVRNILSDGLAIIPVSVSGSMRQPKVIPMDPGLVGSKLLDLAHDTLTLPYRLINPLFSEGSEKD